jgi:hypothetical protein
MRGRTKRLTIAIVLTFVDVSVANYYCGVIWQAFAQYLFARVALLGLLGIWVASAIVIWQHVAHDLRQTLRERDYRLAFDAAASPAEPGGDANV